MATRRLGDIEIVEVDRNGRRYAYPADYPNLARIEASIQLSASHDDGDVEGLKVDPDTYAAQDAFFSTGRAQSAQFVSAMADLIDERFSGFMTRLLADERAVERLRAAGDFMAAGGTVFNAVPHGLLLDIGLLHGAAFVAMAELGYDVQAGIVISHGIAGRGRRFGKDLVCLADALDWACDKVWYVTPRTEKTMRSAYAESVSADHVALHNSAVRFDMAQAQDRGGIFVTIAPSATSYLRLPSGELLLASPTIGTLRVMAHPRSQVMPIAGKFLGAAAPAFEPGDLRRLAGGDDRLVEQGHELITLLAAGMSAIDPGQNYVARP